MIKQGTLVYIDYPYIQFFAVLVRRGTVGEDMYYVYVDEDGHSGHERASWFHEDHRMVPLADDAPLPERAEWLRDLATRIRKATA